MGPVPPEDCPTILYASTLLQWSTPPRVSNPLIRMLETSQPPLTARILAPQGHYSRAPLRGRPVDAFSAKRSDEISARARAIIQISSLLGPNTGSRPYILDRQRTDRSIANTYGRQKMFLGNRSETNMEGVLRQDDLITF